MDAEIIQEVEPLENCDVIIYKCSVCGKVLCVETVSGTASIVNGADECEHFALEVFGNTGWDELPDEEKEKFEFVRYGGTSVYAWRRRK